MKRFTTGCGLMVVLASPIAMARSPIPLDHPTPPPCAADGTCYPNTGEWGYYPVRWRTWPGSELAPEAAGPSPTPAEKRVSPELSHSETPPAELEDAAAPPTSPKRVAPPTAGPSSEETSPDGGTSLPDVPLPDDETPSTSPVTQPTGDLDPPPALPPSVFSGVQSTRGRQVSAPITTPSSTPRVSTGDPPPAPPWAHNAAL